MTHSVSATISNLSEVCTSIGNEVVDEVGFVPVRSLLQRFNAKLILRPLLVEGMFAALSSEDNCDWGVLVDSERYSVPYEAVQQEKLGNALPSRMRYTVAHELAHSLGFRASEFGIELENTKSRRQTQQSFIDDIERATDTVSPLLLCSDKSLNHILTTTPDQPLTPATVVRLCQNYGLSRYVLLNRLRALPIGDSRRQLPALRNLGLFLAKRRSDSGFQLYGRPMFANFDRNIVPAMLLELLQKKNLSAKYGIPDTSFCLTGGSHPSIEVTTTGGTPKLPTAESIRIRVAAEQVSSRSQSSIVVAVHRIA